MLTCKLLSAPVSSCCDRQGFVYIRERLSSSVCKTATGPCRQPALSIPHSHMSLAEVAITGTLHPLCLVLQVTVFKLVSSKMPFISQLHSQAIFRISLS